jgi:hypothetical protein
MRAASRNRLDHPTTKRQRRSRMQDQGNVSRLVKLLREMYCDAATSGA